MLPLIITFIGLVVGFCAIWVFVEDSSKKAGGIRSEDIPGYWIFVFLGVAIACWGIAWSGSEWQKKALETAMLADKKIEITIDKGSRKVMLIDSTLVNTQNRLKRWYN